MDSYRSPRLPLLYTRCNPFVSKRRIPDVTCVSRLMDGKNIRGASQFCSKVRDQFVSAQVSGNDMTGYESSSSLDRI